MRRKQAATTKKVFAILLTIGFSVSLPMTSPSMDAQAGRNPKGPARPTVSLSKPVDWGSFSARMFNDSKKVTFQLTTSWIPGEKQKGRMRYKLYAFPESDGVGQAAATDPELAASEEKIMRRVYECSILLNLYDVDGFVLRKVAIPLSLGVDDALRVRRLSANDSVQMSAQEYRSFLGTAKASGAWNISWIC